MHRRRRGSMHGSSHDLCICGSPATICTREWPLIKSQIGLLFLLGVPAPLVLYASKVAQTVGRMMEACMEESSRGVAERRS